MTGKKKRVQEHPKSRIPEFASREEEAEFWDTHDITDYLGELKPVKTRFAKNLAQGITIRLDPDTLQTLREYVHKEGLGPTTLARMWILEHLREQEEQRSKANAS